MSDQVKTILSCGLEYLQYPSGGSLTLEDRFIPQWISWIHTSCLSSVPPAPLSAHDIISQRRPVTLWLVYRLQIFPVDLCLHPGLGLCRCCRFNKKQSRLCCFSHSDWTHTLNTHSFGLTFADAWWKHNVGWVILKHLELVHWFVLMTRAEPPSLQTLTPF